MSGGPTKKQKRRFRREARRHGFNDLNAYRRWLQRREKQERRDRRWAQIERNYPTTDGDDQ